MVYQDGLSRWSVKEPPHNFVSQLNQPTTIFQTILGLAVVAVAITYMLRSIL